MTYLLKCIKQNTRHTVQNRLTCNYQSLCKNKKTKCTAAVFLYCYQETTLQKQKNKMHCCCVLVLLPRDQNLALSKLLRCFWCILLYYYGNFNILWKLIIRKSGLLPARDHTCWSCQAFSLMKPCNAILKRYNNLII